MQKNNNLREKNISLSFNNAWRGFWTVLLQEPAFKYMVLAGLLVVLAMLYFPTTRTEKAVLLVMVFSVMGLEMINSIMERFLDFLQPDHDPRVKIIKDLLSGFVFLVVIGSAIIGILVLWPHLRTFISL